VARKGPVTADGEHYPLPYPGGTGLGKALKSTLHPARDDIPIIIGAEGPKNVALAAEIGDGWFPIFFSPRHQPLYRQALDEGFARSGARRGPDDFEVVASVPVVVNDDVEAAAGFLRAVLALYIGGMGARQANFHLEVFSRMGYEAEAVKIQDLYLEGRKEEAAATVPVRMVEEVALVGPLDKIRHDLEGWRESMVTTMLVGGPLPLLRTMAELVL
jgi:F420-dependent oxidoreductase-like protein